MKAIAAAALAGIAMASTPSLAADLLGSTPPMTYPDQGGQVEVGSNWYLRGDVGASLDTAATFSMAGVSTPAPGVGVLPFASAVGASNDHVDFSADVAVGYRFNNWVRGEVSYEYRAGPGGGNSNTVICPYSAVAQGLTGYLYNTADTCNGNLELKQHNNTALASAYVDLGNYWGFTPYVGAGAGLNVNVTSGSVSYTETASGTPYAANLSTAGQTNPQVWVNAGGTPISPQPNIAFAQQNWNRSIDNVKYTPAFALMAGVGIQLSPSATLDIGYRYLNAGTVTTMINPETGSTVKQSNTSQEVHIGIRYMAN